MKFTLQQVGMFFVWCTLFDIGLLLIVIIGRQLTAPRPKKQSGPGVEDSPTYHPAPDFILPQGESVIPRSVIKEGAPTKIVTFTSEELIDIKHRLPRILAKYFKGLRKKESKK